MKYLLGLLVLLSLAAPLRAQQKSDAEQEGLRGRVKSVEFGSIEYELKDGKSAEGRRVPIQKTVFDERGNKTEQVLFDQSGGVRERLVYTHDAAGRSTGYDEYSSIVDKSLSHPRRHIYTIDAAGRTLEYTVFDSDGTLASRFTYEYDAQGNKTEELFYGAGGYRTGKLVNTYDGRGNQLTQTSYSADDSVSYKAVNSYDSLNHRIEWVQYQGDKLRYKVLYRYDGEGRLKEQETFEYNAIANMYISHAPIPGKIVITYHDKERTKEEATYNGDGVLTKRVVTSFDGRGDEVGCAEYGGDGSPKDSEVRWYDRNRLLRILSGKSSTKFEYDARGNWTRKTYLMLSAGADAPEAYSAQYRLITYY